MLTDHALSLALHRGDKVQTLEVQTDRALVGSGAHCDVRLSPDEAAVEQLIVETQGEDIYVKVCSFEPSCLLNGAPFVESRLSPGAVVEIGHVALRARLVPLSQVATKARGSSSHTHPLVQALGLLGLGIGFYFVLNAPPPTPSALDAAVVPPALFSAAPPRCPHSDRRAAWTKAEQLRRDAESKRERSPFYPSDGLAAVPLYAQASACYAHAGEPGAARDAQQAAETLERRMADELHVRHVRIERFIAQQKYADLRREVLLAAQYIADKSHPYALWLSALARETEVRMLAQGAK